MSSNGAHLLTIKYSTSVCCANKLKSVEVVIVLEMLVGLTGNSLLGATIAGGRELARQLEKNMLSREGRAN